VALGGFLCWGDLMAGRRACLRKQAARLRKQAPVETRIKMWTATNEAGMLLMHKGLTDMLAARRSLAPPMLLTPGLRLLTLALATNEAGMLVTPKGMHIYLGAPD
jgi:hypothetical protein